MYQQKAIDLYLHGVWSGSDRPEDHEFLASHLPQGHIQRPISLYEWGTYEYYVRHNKEKAKQILEDFLREVVPFKDDKKLSEMISKTERLLSEIKGSYQFSARGSAIRNYRDGLESARKGDYSSAGMSFLNGGQHVEGNWAWERACEKTKSPQIKADSLRRLANTFECLQIWSSAVDVYQRIVDVYLYNYSEEAKAAQRHLDAILRDHPLTDEAKNVSADRLSKLKVLHGTFEGYFASTVSARPLLNEYFRLTGVKRDGHRHCPSQATVVPPMDDPAVSVVEVLDLCRSALNDPNPEVRKEAADALVPLAEKALGSSDVMGGVGIQLDRPDQEVIVVQAVEGMPAQTAGILKGDILVQIDDDACREGLVMREVTARVRGPVGTGVRLKLRRPGEDRLREYRLIRTALFEFQNVQQVVRLLRGALKSEDEVVRLEALRALKVIGQHASEAVPDVTAAIEDTNKEVSKEAAIVLKTIAMPSESRPTP
jgi:hypothetical protein